MKPLEYPLLADENIHRKVVVTLGESGKDVRSVADEDLLGANDSEILRRAHTQRRVVLTHDSDFGRLAIQVGQPFVGVVYIRPGHITSSFVLASLDALERLDIDVPPPFIIVVERRADVVRVRSRSIS